MDRLSVYFWGGILAFLTAYCASVSPLAGWISFGICVFLCPLLITKFSRDE